MEYLPILNLLLEALAYLGRRAAGNTIEHLMDRLRSNGVAQTDPLFRRLGPLEEVYQAITQAVPLAEDILSALFGNLPGFPYNTVGSYSPGFLLLFPQVAKYSGSLAHALAGAQAMGPEELAGQLALALDIADEGATTMPADTFSARVLDLSVPAESKVAILDLFRRPQAVLAQAGPVLRQTIAALEAQRKTLEEICVPFTQALLNTGPADFIDQTSGLSAKPDLGYRLRPFLFGLDTNLATPQIPGEPVQVYCGILRGPIQQALSATRGPEYQVYHAIKLLGDKTRFDILCYLRDRRAYGQELSAKFGLSRNTIHHHMSKLLAARLVSCTVDGNRVYYTVDRESVSDLLNRQRALLLPQEEKGEAG